MTETTGDRVLSALRTYDVKPQRKAGTYYVNSPLRPGSNSHAMKLTIADDGEHGAFYDHVSGDRGTLYELAQHLQIETAAPRQEKPTAKGYANLAEYAQAHGTPAAAYITAGWNEVTHNHRKALRFDTANGPRYRYLDGEKPKFWHASGYQRCWYGLDFAVALAVSTGQPLVLCNGEPSVIAAQHYGVAAACMTGSGENELPEHLLSELQQHYSGPILIALDSDTKGRAAAPRLAEQVNGTAVDLGGSHGFDLAEFCTLHGDDAPDALLKCKRLGQEDFWAKGVTAKTLRTMHFEPLHWVVDDILPEGCTLLAGKPKARKSWLALNIGLAVALGGRAMSFKNANKGDVLYLDLESNERRAQRRLESTLRDMEWPDNFHLFTEWPKLDDGGDVLLEKWMDDHPNTKLIVIDVFQDIRAVANPKAQLYSDDRAAVEPLRRFASKYHVAVLIIHHTRKAKGDDVFDEISGSTGLTGGVDNIMVLSRDAEDGDKASLAIRGRDIEFDNALQLEWDFDFCQWRYKGEDSAAGEPAERKALLKLMQPGFIYTPAELAPLCNKTAKNVSKMLRLLESSRLVASAGFGKYTVVDDSNNDDVSEGRSGGSGGTSRSGRSSGSGMSSPLLPLPPQGYREVEVYSAMESQETATSTTSTTSTLVAEMSELNWVAVQRWHAAGSVNNIRLHCAKVGVPFDAVMDELRGDELEGDE